MSITSCSLCHSSSLTAYEELFSSALANNLAPDLQSSLSSDLYPLALSKCDDCNHVQLTYRAKPEDMFDTYNYQSSVSSFFRDHFSAYASDIAKLTTRPAPLKPTPKVLDIGSNDSFLLDCFSKIGFETYGVEPASNLAELSSPDHIIFNTYFNYDSSFDILRQVGRFNLVTANNVFAHVPDLLDFAKGVSNILHKDDGFFVFEVQYLKSLIENDLFDMIYHEHTSYHHLGPLVSTLPKVGLHVMDASIVNSHGGSLRVTCSNNPAARVSSNVISILNDEINGFSTSTIHKTLSEFMYRTITNTQSISSFIESYASKGFQIFGYTAPAKATTLISGLSQKARESIEFIIDDAPFKVDKYIPSTSIKVLSFDQAQQTYFNEGFGSSKALCIVFAWNIAPSVVQKLVASGQMPSNLLYSSLLPEPKIINV